MGQFSWFTQDTDRQIGSQPENTIKVTMFDDKGNTWEERNYEGYGVFGGKDYYDLVAEMNGWNEDNYKEYKSSFRPDIPPTELREVGIDIYFEEENKGYKFPGLRQVYLPNHVKMHDFTKKPIDDPNQSWYQGDDEYDEDGYFAKGGKVNPYFVRQSFYSEISDDGKEELDDSPIGIRDGYTGTGNDTRVVYYVDGYNYLLEEEPELIEDEVFRVEEEVYVDYTDKDGKKKKVYMLANSPDAVVRRLKKQGAKSIEDIIMEWEYQRVWDKGPNHSDYEKPSWWDDLETTSPQPITPKTNTKKQSKKAVVNNKKIEKAIGDEINNFDDIEFGFYRYKYWEADEYMGDWFIDYITQEDYRNEGEELLLDRLEKIAKKFKVNIYLYYKVRDKAATSDRNKVTKKGYIEAVEMEVGDADIGDAVYGMDKWLPDDDDSIREFQDIEDNGTVEDMIEYLNGWGDEDILYDRYGLTSDNYPAIAKKIMGKSYAKGGETKQTVAVYDMAEFLQSQLDYFIDNPKEFEERADYLLEDEYEREKYEEDKEEYIRNWFYSSDSDSYDWYWDDVKEELAIEFDKYIDDRVFVKGRNMGWRNREGTKTFVLEDTEQMLRELVPENTDFTYYLYKIKDGEYEARVSHHDSPMGEYFEIKIEPNYINRIYLENNDGERIGLIYVDSSELGKVEKLEDHEFENFSYWKDEDEDDEGNYVVLQYNFEDTKKNIDKNFDEFVKHFPNSTLTEEFKEINY